MYTMARRKNVTCIPDKIEGKLILPSGNIAKGTFDGCVTPKLHVYVDGTCNIYASKKRLDKCDVNVTIARNVKLNPTSVKRIRKMFPDEKFRSHYFENVIYEKKFKDTPVTIGKCYPKSESTVIRESFDPVIDTEKDENGRMRFYTERYSRCNIKVGDNYYAPASLNIKI